MLWDCQLVPNVADDGAATSFLACNHAVCCQFASASLVVDEQNSLASLVQTEVQSFPQAAKGSRCSRNEPPYRQADGPAPQCTAKMALFASFYLHNACEARAGGGDVRSDLEHAYHLPVDLLYDCLLAFNGGTDMPGG